MEPMASTGLPPFFELVIDGGTIGKYYSRCRDSVLIAIAIFSVPVPPYTMALMLDIINEGDDGSRAASISKMKKMADDLGIPWDHFLSKMAVACGDGVYAGGGEDARHHGPRAFESDAFWVDPDVKRVLWDFSIVWIRRSQLRPMTAAVPHHLILFCAKWILYLVWVKDE
jgi:hypothetical protein